MIKRKITDILLLIISIVYTIGVNTWFKVCEPMSETYMSCHWAGEVLKIVSIMTVIITLAHICFNDHKIKIGMNIGLLFFYILMLMIPGHVIDICQMEDMMCHTTQLYTTIFSAVLIVLTAIDTYINYHGMIKEKHSREYHL